MTVDRKSSKVEQASWEDVDRELFDHLRTLRKTIADEIGKPPYVVFPDTTLRALAKHRPATNETLIFIRGVGEKKQRRYGSRFLEALDDWSAKHGGGRDIGLAAP
jgi:ATP-dependent DNA helicase RecQ